MSSALLSAIEDEAPEEVGFWDGRLPESTFGLTSELHVAAYEGNLGTVKRILAGGLDPSAEDLHGRTALHWAAFGNRRNVAAFLLEKGANVNARDGGDFTPLLVACLHHEPELAGLLLQENANPSLADSHGAAPLHHVAQHQHKDLVVVFHVHGADVDIHDAHGRTPLVVAVAHNLFDSVKAFLGCGADLSAKDNRGMSVLHYALGHGFIELTESLLALGANPNARNDSGATPLHFAVYEGHSEAVDMLVRKGADCSLMDTEHCTALHWAAHLGGIPCIARLLALGAELEAKDLDGHTPLLRAGIGGHHDSCGFLLEQGANVASIDGDGRTLLHYLAAQGDMILVKTLLSSGVDLDSGDAAGVTPAHCAAFSGHAAPLRELVALGAAADKRDSGGRQCLHYSASGGHVDTIHTIMALVPRVHVNAMDEDGLTALDYADAQGETEASDVLRTYGGRLGSDLRHYAATCIAAWIRGIKARRQLVNMKKIRKEETMRVTSSAFASELNAKEDQFKARKSYLKMARKRRKSITPMPLSTGTPRAGASMPALAEVAEGSAGAEAREVKSEIHVRGRSDLDTSHVILSKSVRQLATSRDVTQGALDVLKDSSGEDKGSLAVVRAQAEKISKTMMDMEKLMYKGSQGKTDVMSLMRSFGARQKRFSGSKRRIHDALLQLDHAVASNMPLEGAVADFQRVVDETVGTARRDLLQFEVSNLASLVNTALENVRGDDPQSVAAAGMACRHATELTKLVGEARNMRPALFLESKMQHITATVVNLQLGQEELQSVVVDSHNRDTILVARDTLLAASDDVNLAVARAIDEHIRSITKAGAARKNPEDSSADAPAATDRLPVLESAGGKERAEPTGAVATVLLPILSSTTGGVATSGGSTGGGEDSVATIEHQYVAGRRAVSKLQDLVVGGEQLDHMEVIDEGVRELLQALDASADTNEQLQHDLTTRMAELQRAVDSASKDGDDEDEHFVRAAAVRTETCALAALAEVKRLRDDLNTRRLLGTFSKCLAGLAAGSHEQVYAREVRGSVATISNTIRTFAASTTMKGSKARLMDSIEAMNEVCSVVEEEKAVPSDLWDAASAALDVRDEEAARETMLARSGRALADVRGAQWHASHPITILLTPTILDGIRVDRARRGAVTELRFVGRRAASYLALLTDKSLVALGLAVNSLGSEVRKEAQALESHANAIDSAVQVYLSDASDRAREDVVAAASPCQEGFCAINVAIAALDADLALSFACHAVLSALAALQRTSSRKQAFSASNLVVCTCDDLINLCISDEGFVKLASSNTVVAETRHACQALAEHAQRAAKTGVSGQPRGAMLKAVLRMRTCADNLMNESKRRIRSVFHRRRDASQRGTSPWPSDQPRTPQHSRTNPSPPPPSGNRTAAGASPRKRLRTQRSLALPKTRRPGLSLTPQRSDVSGSSGGLSGQRRRAVSNGSRPMRPSPTNSPRNQTRSAAAALERVDRVTQRRMPAPPSSRPANSHTYPGRSPRRSPAKLKS